jgi:hypothetical protein
MVEEDDEVPVYSCCCSCCICSRCLRQVVVAVIGAPASDAILAEAGGQDLPKGSSSNQINHLDDIPFYHHLAHTSIHLENKPG